MKYNFLAIAIMAFAAIASAAQEATVLKTQKDKVSYGIGMDAARGFQQKGLDLELEMIIKGLRDGYPGGKPLMTDDEIRATLMAFQQELRQKEEEALKALAEKNKKEGDAFLVENKTKEGVVTLASGLQYKILKAGDGKIPIDTDTVEVHYQGTLINGTEFDSSIKRGKPLTFPIKQIIAGWSEALKLMPVGSKWQLFIPPELAYGTEANGDIGPNSVLIFEAELLAIK